MADQTVTEQRPLKENKQKPWLAPRYRYPALIILLLILCCVALMLGRYPASIGDIFMVFKLRITGGELGNYATLSNIIFETRLPRILAAMLVGAALSVSGASYQGVFKNPLVSSDLLGVSAGAGFGAALAILLSMNMFNMHLMSFGFGLAAVLASYLISTRIGSVGKENTLVMVLAGILVSTVFNALVSLVKTVADPFNKLPAITYWLMGSLSSTTNEKVWMVALPIIIGIIPLFLFRWQLNILSFGEEEAQALGVQTGRLKLLIIVCATLITASAVSISGIIGWVGLVIPHLARAIAGPNYKDLIPMSIFLGAAYLLVVDTFARTLLTMDIPLGILTALIGAPFFVYLLNRIKGSW